MSRLTLSAAPAAAPVVGAVLPVGRCRACLLAALARLDASRPQQPARPAPAAPIADTTSAPAYVALARAQATKYDADRAFWAVRDEYHGPGRFAALLRTARQRRAARAAMAAAAAAYHATPRAAAERAVRARYAAQYGTPTH